MVKLRAFFVPALVLAAVSILAVPAFTAPVYRIGKISTKSAWAGASPSYEAEFVAFKNYIYFAGGTTGAGGTGIELWRTDGTEAGTTLVKDINQASAAASSDPTYLTVVPNPLLPPSDPNYETLYFSATDGVNGRELWKSDGTPAGTVMVADIVPGSSSSSPSQLTAVAGQVAFNCSNKLCKSDGTAAGTVGPLSLVPAASPARFVELDGVVYFWGVALYRWDLQTAPVDVSSPLAPRVQEIFEMNGKIYFTTQLWNSTFFVYDPATGVTSHVLDMPSWKAAVSLTVVGSRALFVRYDTQVDAGDGLWAFSGAGVSMITSVVPLTDQKELGGALFFAADDGVHGWELWTSDGFTAHMVKDINPGPGGSGVASSGGIDDPFRTATAFAGSVYFFADDGVHGKELWKTDGTEAGTALVEDIVPGFGSSYAFYGGARGYSDEYLALGVVPAGGSGSMLHALSLRPPRFAIDDLTVAEGTGGLTNAVVTVHVIPPSTVDTSVQWATSDGTATAGGDYTAATGTLNFPAGTASQTVSVAVNSDATPEVGEEAFHVQLSGSSGPPIGRGLADVTILDDDGPTLSIDDITVQENAGTATFTVTRSAATADPVSVRYATADGTATAGSDYTAKTGTVTFSAGQLTRPVTVTITNDQSQEPDEAFYVRLSDADYAVIGDAEGQCTIANDDGPPTLTVPDVAVTEGNSGTSNLTFTASLSAASAYAVSVDFATADGTATAGVDYQAQSGTLTIPAGTSSATVVVPIIGDVVDEPNETFTLDLGNPVNATLARTQATGTINDNDVTGISITNVTVTEGDSGTTVSATFTVTLSNPNSLTVTVDYATAPGTSNPATEGADYTGASGTLSFPAGTTSLPLPVTVIGDDVDEGPNETFFVNLTNPTNASLQDAQGLGTITEDDDARFRVGDVSVVEGNTGNVAVTLTVSLGSAYETDSSVKYYTSNGSATVAGGDFVGISNGSAAGAVLLSFPAGTVSQQVTVEVIGDTTREASNEYFNFNLTGASGGPAIADGQARVTILDDDLLATDRRLSIAPKAASVTEPDSGETPVSFTVSLIPASGATPTPSGLPVTVSLVAGGTASAPGDYTGVPASLTFAPGTTTQTVTAAVQADSVLENPEAAILTLANPTNATIAPVSTTTSGSATLHIYDAVSRAPLDFYTVAPCRAVDTRDAAKGGPAPVAAGSPRTFIIGGVCEVPPTARAISVNVTVANASAAGNLRVYPGGTPLPSTSNLNYAAGKTIANNAIVLLGSLADVTVAVAPAGTADVIIDVNGYME